MSLYKSLNRVIKHVNVEETDQAAIALARKYAKMMDANSELTIKLGPKFLDCIESLLMTPRSRSRFNKSKDEDDEPDALDEFTAKRISRAENLDAPAT